MNRYISKAKNNFIKKVGNFFIKRFKYRLKRKEENNFTKYFKNNIKKFDKIIKTFSKIDKDFLHIANKCLVPTFYFCLFSSIFLIIYKYFSIPSLFLIGITFLKYGVIYLFSIIIFTLSFSYIKNDIT